MRSPNIKIVCLSAFALSLNPIEMHSQEMSGYAGQVFPANHALNMPIDSLPIHPNSDNYVAGIGINTALHPDFGTDYDGHPMGIPYNLVGASQTMVAMTFEYESDPGHYPIPIPPLVEGLNTYTDDDDGDRHILVIDTVAHRLYETWYTWPPGHTMPYPGDWDTYPPSNPSDWWAGSGAVFDLTSNALRTAGETSADAAGLPIFPLLIRYDELLRAEAAGGEIPHAIRFTVQNSQRAYVWPARHYASSSTDPNRPPMGLRFRLKASVDISGFSSRMQVILRTMKKYGIIVSDNGGDWFFQGTHDERWDDDELSTLKSLRGTNFEAVDIGPWTIRPGFDPNSAAVPPADGSSIPANVPKVPIKFSLFQNYPNPFNPSTKISFFVGTYGHTSLRVYDILGREIRTLVNQVETPGYHTVEWDGRSFAGQKVGSGIYFYRLSVVPTAQRDLVPTKSRNGKTESGFTKTQKMLMLK